MGLPNCHLQEMYLMALSQTPWAIPAASQHTQILECWRITLVPLLNVVAFGNFCSSFTWTLDRVMWQFWTTRSGSLCLMTVEVNPGEFLFQRMQPQTCLLSVLRAQMMSKSRLPFPIHLFVPFSLQPSAVFVTDVYRLLASLPILSSVRPHPPTKSKLEMLGMYLCFCYSDPNLQIVQPKSPYWTRHIVAHPASPLANSATIVPRAVVRQPFPYGALKKYERRPSYFNLGRRYSGNLDYQMQGVIEGIIYDSTNLRTVNLNSQTHREINTFSYFVKKEARFKQSQLESMQLGGFLMHQLRNSNLFIRYSARNANNYQCNYVIAKSEQ